MTKRLKVSISSHVVAFLDLHAPVAYAPGEITRCLEIDEKHVEAVRAALKCSTKRGVIVHERHGMYRSATVEPRGECQCPRCRKKGLRKYVDVTVEAPAECRALDKHGIRSPDVVVVSVNWDRERYFCKKCGWSSREKRTK